VIFFFQAEDGIRDYKVTGVQTCALPIYQGNTVTSSTPQKFVSNLNELPYPDHDDYFHAFHSSTASSIIVPEMTMETSRGCWWGRSEEHNVGKEWRGGWWRER